MHRRVFIKKTWLSAFSYSQSHISKKVCGLHLYVCKNYISLTYLNGFLAIVNFDNILFLKYISFWSLFQHVNNSKKTKQLLGF
jgi:hypothetical protein